MSASGVAGSSQALTSSSSTQSGWRWWTLAIEGAAAAVTSTHLAVIAPGPPQVSAAILTGAFAPGRRAQ